MHNRATMYRLAAVGMLALLLALPVRAAPLQAATGTLALDKTFVTTPGATVTITLTDADLNVGVTQNNEASDYNGVAYSFPFTAGNDAGLQQQVRVKKFPILDSNGDGNVNFQDVAVNYADLEILQVSANDGLVTVRAKVGEATAAATAYTLTYKAAAIQDTPCTPVAAVCTVASTASGAVKVSSTQDTTGFVILLRETGPDTGIFKATFKTAVATSAINADDPTNATRPTIAVVTGNIITVSYVDASPAGVRTATASVAPSPAATTLVQTSVDTDAATGLKLSILLVYDATTGLGLPGALVGSYQATLSYNGALLNVLDVRQKAPLSTGGETINNPGGSTSFDGSAPGGAAWPLDPLAFVALRLTGCATDPVALTPAFAQILDPSGVAMQIDQPPAKTFRRGDARADGTVNLADGLFIAQYLAGLRGLGEDTTKVNAVNAASVKQDGAFDVISAADVLFIAQRAVGLRDACFLLLAPPPPTPTPTPTPAPTPTPVPIPVTVHSHIANSTHQSWTLPLGSTVIWHNHDSAPHTSTSGTFGSPSGFWNSGSLSLEQTFSHTFTTAGSYPYFCAFHTSMTATININP